MAEPVFQRPGEGGTRFFDGFAALETPGPAAFETVGAEVGMDVVGPPLAQSDPV